MKNKLLITSILFLCFSFVPVFVHSQELKLDYSGWVQCDGVLTKGEEGRQVLCNFNNLIGMVNYLVNWMFVITIPIMIGLISYSGFLYMTGKQENIKKAKAVMTSAVVGFIIALLAWFMVATIVNWIKNPNFTGTDSLLKK